MSDPGEEAQKQSPSDTRRVKRAVTAGAVSTEIDAERGVAVLTFSGLITADMIRSVQAEMRAGPGLNAGRAALLDYTQADVSELDVKSIKELAASTPVAPGARRAFVVSDDAAYCVARMYRAFSEISVRGVSFEVFRDRQEALRWLMTKDEAATGDVAPLVLVVEDEVLIRMAIADYLRKSGYVVVEAGDPVQAFGIVHKTAKVDVVLTDIKMPGPIDGFGLARWIRKNRPEIPVVTASGMRASAAAWADAEDRPDLIKPYDYREVEARIRAALDANRRGTAPAG